MNEEFKSMSPGNAESAVKNTHELLRGGASIKDGQLQATAEQVEGARGQMEGDLERERIDGLVARAEEAINEFEHKLIDLSASDQEALVRRLETKEGRRWAGIVGLLKAYWNLK